METQHLNRAQKRAQAIKTELQQLDSDHLNTFIDGVGDIEPPKYRRVGAKIVPDLAMVDLKQGVETYNIGNVYFQEADELRNVNFRIDLATKTFKIDRRDRLPKDQGSLAIPILQSVAQEFIPLWKVKYQRIIEQKDIINEIRRLARNVFNQPPRLSVNGKAPGSQMSGIPSLDDRMDNAEKSRKRVSGGPVAPHPSNKRARVSMLAMSDATKCETFAKIEDKFKVELFNAMVKAAFPGFENVLTAAWNVVSVYGVVGSEFKGLHKAVTDLQTVLEEFEAAQGDTQSKAAPREKPERDHDAVDHGNGFIASTSALEGPMKDVVRHNRPTQGAPSSPQHNMIKKSVITSGTMRETAPKIAHPTARSGEEVSDNEARKKKFAEIKRRIEAKPRYTPTRRFALTQGRESSAMISDSTTQDEEEMTNEQIQQPCEQDGTPQGVSRVEEISDHTISEDIVGSLDANIPHLGLKQEEHEVSKFNHINESERQHQHQVQQQPHHQPQERWQCSHDGRKKYYISNPFRGESRGSREMGNEEVPPTDNNQRSFNHNQSFGYAQSRQQEMGKSQPQTEKPEAAPAIWLGTSKLGAKKGTATANGAAPVAPMMHTIRNEFQHMSEYNQQHARQDRNELERRRLQ